MPPANIRLPLDPLPDLLLGVYCPVALDPGDRAGLLAHVAPWLASHCPPRLRRPLAEFAFHSISFQLEATAGLPEPCPHSVAELGAEDRMRYGLARHLLLIETTDDLRPPRTGLWAVLAAARSIADAVGGVVFDPAHTHLLPNGDPPAIPGGGRIAISHHVLTCQSVGRSGLGWTTTLGMGKFGLPNLELRDYPPHLSNLAGWLVSGVAQVLAERAAAAVRSGQPTELAVEPLLRLRLADVVRSGLTAPGSASGSAGGTHIRIAYPGGRDGPDRFAQVLPEGGGERTVALVAALRELFGTGRSEAVCVPIGDPAVAQARAAARASLPDALVRFQHGLRPGEMLAVKHGFPYGRRGQREFMWVTVTRTRQGHVAGRLVNDSDHRSDLRPGQEVVLPLDEVDDWVLVRADGTVEGDYTSRAIG